MNESSHVVEAAPQNFRPEAAPAPAAVENLPADAPESERFPAVFALLHDLDRLGQQLAADLRRIYDRYDDGRISRMQLVDELDARLMEYDRDRRVILDDAAKSSTD